MKTRTRKVRSARQFPGKLHDMMSYVEHKGLESAISWVQKGNGIIINDPDKLLDILPLFFGQTKIRSLHRQLNMWNFHRVLAGPERGAFLHPYFVRGNKSMCARMSRHIDPMAKPEDIKVQSKIGDDQSIEEVLKGHNSFSLGDDQAVAVPTHKFVDYSSSNVNASCSLEEFITNDEYSLDDLLLVEDTASFATLHSIHEISSESTSEDLEPAPIMSSIFELETSCPGMSEPASPELIESIFDELSGYDK